MHTQNTPVHIKLWHHDFWRLAFANMFLSMSVYMFIPVLPLFLLSVFTPQQVAACMVSFGIGIFALGGFSTYLIQRYRRNSVCMWAILLIAACVAAIYYVKNNMSETSTYMWLMVALLRLFIGALFGLAQIVLMSTLIIDVCESFKRTEANYSSSWFGRFSLSVGPMLALVIYRHYGFDYVLAASAVCSLLSVVLIRLVNFPFKAPEDKLSLFSLDRFFLPHGFWLFVNFMLTAMAVGMVLTLGHTPLFYGMMMIGFFFALLSQKFVFVNAELKSEIITGLMIMAFALLMLNSGRDMARLYIAPVFIGLGIGVVSARYLLFFIKLSNHCQRGTSQSTYILAWESGLALGMAIGFGCFYPNKFMLTMAALALVVVSLLMYNFFTHSWYIRNKNR